MRDAPLGGRVFLLPGYFAHGDVGRAQNGLALVVVISSQEASFLCYFSSLDFVELTTLMWTLFHIHPWESRARK